ncbi:CC0125/CC1285 family lipoprotein [Brevundimonas sp.]|uniref:CC0125/CC1285 family lipoprotein n=1 Tax=Brevundimonas sp. TaxID=1871086 RepID=UPI00391D209E
MRRVILASVAALALTACATATPYQAASPQARGGYSEMQIEQNRFRVGFAGNSVTSRETVEMYLLYRAAELTAQNGFEWFQTVDRVTDRDTRYVASPDPWFSSHYGPYWGPSWRFYHRGYWSPWGSSWGRDMDVREITRFEANTEILMGRGAKPNDPNAFDAREVLQNVGPRVVRPSMN